ncbi:deoxyribose-phosphate aldolase [Francisella sp. 19X1-34]|uniref:deoxyribose-phosphate aldolase n=1 Tax=Francisella sp. 19X1-34 TaxID=3087177 RepID=UPI002E2EDCA3|nr:deoxyribose-phosphate aldolase [Francisella sp. 19X1-34]MED7788187.1 deoxyribose-phosphate aldolase [Francisella sp. 19X1-34]
MVSQFLRKRMTSKEKIVSLMDLTLLGDNDTDSDIVKLCSKARNSLGNVAALCVYKEFIPTVKKQLGADFKVATVVNFPKGDASIEDVLSETKQALTLGADEIDLVIDYKEYIAKGDSKKSREMISQVKELCNNKILKVIIESGELQSTGLIEKVSSDAISSGADFIKTSTGKTKVGATCEAAKTMLETIKKLNQDVGFKASGGIRDCSQAVAYVELADKILCNNYVNPKTFRFGVSGLLDNLLNNLGQENNDY